MLSGKLKGKKALITSAGREPGNHLAQAFAAEGVWVALQDYAPNNLDALEEGIKHQGDVAKSYVADLAKKNPVQNLITDILDSWGAIDFLIHFASINPRESLFTLDEWDWRRTLDTNLSASFFLMQSVGRVMSQQGGGTCLVVCPNMATSSGKHPGVVSLASQWGVLGLTRAFALESSARPLNMYALCLVNEVTKGYFPAFEEPEFDISSQDANSPYQQLIAAALALCSQPKPSLSGNIWEITI